MPQASQPASLCSSKVQEILRDVAVRASNRAFRSRLEQPVTAKCSSAPKIGRIGRARAAERRLKCALALPFMTLCELQRLHTVVIASEKDRGLSKLPARPDMTGLAPSDTSIFWHFPAVERRGQLQIAQNPSLQANRHRTACNCKRRQMRSPVKSRCPRSYNRTNDTCEALTRRKAALKLSARQIGPRRHDAQTERPCSVGLPALPSAPSTGFRESCKRIRNAGLSRHGANSRQARANGACGAPQIGATASR